MAQQVKNGNPSSTEPGKEMSMEMRLLVAFLLMGAVMFLTPYFFKGPPPVPPKKAPTAAASLTPAPTPPGAQEHTAPNPAAPSARATKAIRAPPCVAGS